MAKLLYHIYNQQTFEVIGAAFFEESQQPNNSTLSKNEGFLKPMYDLENNIIFEGATSEEVLENQNIKIALHEKYPELVGMNHQLLQLDNLPGIKRLEPISDKGLKGEKLYTKEDQLIWSITTKYWFENDSTYTDGVVKIVKLFNVGGAVIDSWTKEVALSVDDKEQILKEQRERILTYFKSQQPALFSLLYTFFKSDIDNYVSVGNKSAFEAVLTDASINHPYQDQGVYVVRETLSMEIPTQAGGTTTVLQGILNELV